MKKLNLVFFVFFCLLLPAKAQQKTISGTVMGANDSLPIIGATVQIKGTPSGVVTDANGKFQISASENSTLEVRFMGMKTKEVVVGTSDTMDVLLDLDVLGINDVIIVAYGVQKNEARTGSVGVVKSDNIKYIPETSIDRMLNGKVAGVVVSSSTGQPGGKPEIRIRGTSTIFAGNQPLYIIDGIPLMEGDQRVTHNIPVMEGDQSVFVNTSNPLSSINPYDIESISILKDAAAASIYGSRAANGIILINTRSGKSGKSKFAFRTSGGVETLANDNHYYPMTAKEFLQYSRDAVINAGLNPDDSSNPRYYYPVSLLKGPTTDWINILTRKGKIYNAELDVEGGNENTSTFFSGSYLSNEGPFYGVKFENFQVRSNVDHKISKKLKIGSRINAAYSNTKDVMMQQLYYVNPLVGSFQISPFTRNKNSDGSYNLIIPEYAFCNPRASAEYDDQWEKQYRLNGTVYFEWNIIKDLSFKTTNNIQTLDGEGRRYYNPLSNYGLIKGYLQVARTKYIQTTTSNTLKYQKAIGDHSFQVFAGQEATKYNHNVYFITSPDVLPEIPFPNTGTSANDDADYNESAYTLLSFFGMLDYNFNDKYFLKASIRTDGSSRFGSDNRWGTFWSLGGSWNMHNEQFIKNLVFVNQLKLRASYGLSGNFNIGYYEQFGLYKSIEYNKIIATAPQQPPNPDLGWETNKEFNIAIDWAFLDRLSGSIEWYTRNTENMLLNYPLSHTSGFSSIRENIGKLNNRGFEFMLDAGIIQGKYFNWNAGFIISNNRSKILNLGKVDQFINPDNVNIFGGDYLLHKVGERLYSFYLYDYAGVDPANGDALWRKENGELTNKFSEARRVIKGSPEPKLAGGLTTNLSWKGISLDLVLEFKYGNDVLIPENFIVNSDGAQWTTNQANTALDYWKKPGDITTNPKPIADNTTSSNTSSSSRWLYDGSYIRFRNLTLSYMFPKILANKIKLKDLKVYGSASNIYTFSQVPYFDPERGVQGAGYGIFPQTKKFVLGLELSF